VCGGKRKRKKNEMTRNSLLSLPLNHSHIFFIFFISSFFIFFILFYFSFSGDSLGPACECDKGEWLHGGEKGKMWKGKERILVIIQKKNLENF